MECKKMTTRIQYHLHHYQILGCNYYYCCSQQRQVDSEGRALALAYAANEAAPRVVKKKDTCGSYIMYTLAKCSGVE